MKCKNCNIYLPVNYTLCPLCGNDKLTEETGFFPLSVVPYSDEAPAPVKKEKKPATYPSFEKLKAYFNI